MTTWAEERKTVPGTPPENRSSEYDITNAQPPKDNRRRKHETRESTYRRECNYEGTTRPRNRPRSDEKAMLEMSVRKSEVSLGKIEEHLDDNSCPKSVRYTAWAKIRPNPEFKTDIKRIQKEAEWKMLRALKKFHHRSMDRNKAKLRELERKSRYKNQTSTSTSTDVKRHCKNIETDVMPNVNIQEQIDQLKQMMEEIDKANQNKGSESYPCLLSEGTDKLKRGKDKEKRKKKKTKDTCRKIACQKRHRATHDANK